MVTSTTRTQVFVSYSHNDAAWLARLQIHLNPLVREGAIDLWDDTRLVAGSQWRSEIKEALAVAKVAILLISADFLASDFIANEELPVLLTAAEQGGALILPVIVEHSRFTDTELARFQAVNDPARPLSSMRRNGREQALVSLSRTVEKAVRLSSAPKVDADDTSETTKSAVSETATAFRDLIKNMDEIARELRLVTKDGRTGRNYQPALTEIGTTNTSGIGVYSTRRGVEFNLTPFRESGKDAEADELLERISDVTGQRVTARHWPAVPCESLLADWPLTKERLIEPYFRARARLVDG